MDLPIITPYTDLWSTAAKAFTVRYDGHLRWLKYVGSGEMCTHHGRFCEELKCLQILTITQAGHLFWPGVQLFELKLKLSPDLHKVICQVG